jgi:catalase
MPLPSDEKIVQLANQIAKVFQALPGNQPGYRPAHAKGILLKGTFTPALKAASLTRAPHIQRASTPVVVRFSDGSPVPMIPDNDPNASPKGCAIRFYMAEHVHTDIVSHSSNAFPAKNGEEFLAFLQAVVSGKAPEFLADHPAAREFVLAPKPSPVSFATETFFGLTALRFINREGLARYGRYRIVPQAGNQYLEAETAKSKGASYLFDEIKQRLARGPIRINVDVQIANEGDVVNDCTVHWPESRPVISLGTVALTELAPDDETQHKIIFDPLPRVEGIEPSDDPLLELRAAVYLLTGRMRRQAIDSHAPVANPA